MPTTYILLERNLRTRVKKSTCFEHVLILDQKDMFLKLKVLLKFVKIQKMTQQNHKNCLTKSIFFIISYLQYNVYYSCSIMCTFLG